jgi:hypothetical protein
MTMLWTIVFNVLIHAILLGAMGLFVVVLVRLTLSTYDSMERVKRVLALFAGAMVIVGAQASGLNFAEFMARALSVGRASSAAAAIVSSIVAGIAGLGIGYLLVRLFRQHNELAVRIICLVGMLSLSAFIQSYATITAASGVFLGATAAPNIAFTSGLILIFVFTDSDQRHSSSSGLIDRVARRLGLRDTSRSPNLRASQVSGTRVPSGNDEKPSEPRDPYDF